MSNSLDPDQAGQNVWQKCPACSRSLNYDVRGSFGKFLACIITPQCVHKMLSNYTFLETRIQRLLDGLIFVKKGLGVHVQHMLKMSRGLYTGGNYKQNSWEKNEGKLGTLKAIMICQINDLVPTNFLLEYIMRSLLAGLTPLYSENVD